MKNSVEKLLNTDIQSILSSNKYRDSTECKICEAPARYSYFGAIVCESCKMFFKRNAEIREKIVKHCIDGNCEIKINTRQTCAYCRLKKCFDNGMSVLLIRPRRYRPNKRIRNQIISISPLIQIQSNSSLLNINQRTLLSNLIHCFDEYGDSLFVNHLNHDKEYYQFEYLSVKDFFQSIMNKVQLILEKNRDFLSLSSNDRYNLLRLTVEHASGLGGMIILRQHQLFDYSSFYQIAEKIFQPTSAMFTKQVIEKLDFDNIFLKIMLTIISFSTLNYTIYTNQSKITTMNVNAILKIQNMYIELAWLYLLYKYNHEEAVKKLLNFIRCIFLVNRATVEAYESKLFHNIIDHIIQQNQPTIINLNSL